MVSRNHSVRIARSRPYAQERVRLVLVVVIAAALCQYANSASAQGGDRVTQRAAREHQQQMRQQLKADRDRRFAPSAQAPANFAAPSAAPANSNEAVMGSQRLSVDERRQLREQLRHASRQRQMMGDQIAP